MDDLHHPPDRVREKTHIDAFVRAEASIEDENYAEQIIDALADHRLAHVLVFANPAADFTQLIRRLHASCQCPVAGCTTAGEIGQKGYSTDSVVAIGFPRKLFAARTILFEGITSADMGFEVDRMIRERIAFQATNPRLTNGFSFLMVDGLSRCEDALVNAIAPNVTGFPLFGGSAGDGLRFKSSFVAYNGRVYQDAATLTLVATECLTNVFSINHMVPADTHMVVTEADPAQRVVKSINAEPAAAEYARLIGKDPAQLDELVFAGNPVMVCVGGEYHVRAIQRVNEDGNLVFFSAIDEGMVLTVASANDMAGDLDAKLSEVRNGYQRPSILGCDCVLRRIEAERGQNLHRVNTVLRKHGVVGMSTYGEQIGTLHVNHTMTGVAIFPEVSAKVR
ncbi:MAG: FIST N-terminal domain-containing protein [Pseudomonadota bacterium]